MDMEGAQSRGVEQARRKDLPICDHDHDICADLANPRLRGVLSDALGLKDIQAKFHREPLCCRWEQSKSAAGDAVGLGDHQRDLVPGLPQLVQRRLAK
jgi:hypothetical protein